jgi:mycothiol synthase
MYREGDIPAIADMIAACAAVDSFDKPVSVEELTDSYAQPLSEPLKQVILVDGPKQDGMDEGTILATSRVMHMDDAEAEQRIYQLRVRVHPAVRGTGIEQAIAQQTIAHIRANESSGDLPARDKVDIIAGTSEEDLLGKTIYEAIGLKAVRYGWTMERSLMDAIPEPKIVEGVLCRNYQRPEDNEEMLTAYNNSFIDHYEFHAITQDILDYMISRPDTRPDLSWVAEIKDGENTGKFAGYCICEMMEKENERTDNKEGWIALLGTVRSWRGVGLGKSLLLQGLRSLKEAGMETALLGVDSESLTGANRLYESVGFTLRDLQVLYRSALADIPI